MHTVLVAIPSNGRSLVGVEQIAARLIAGNLENGMKNLKHGCNSSSSRNHTNNLGILCF
jgi:hypothetical protein